MNDPVTWPGEAARFGAYLVGEPLSPHLVDRYVRAMSALDLSVDDRDSRLLRRMVRHPWSIGFIDGGLALRRPRSVVRTKLLVMSAILEATPEYADKYLPTGRSPLYLLYAGLVAIRAGCRGLVGAVLVSVL